MQFRFSFWEYEERQRREGEKGTGRKGYGRKYDNNGQAKISKVGVDEKFIVHCQAAKMWHEKKSKTEGSGRQKFHQ